nr:MAG TPA: hypothetical protein [Caudoviricetes sp.]
MLGYMLEWLILMLLVWLVYKIFGKVFEKEDIYLFTAVWSVANICVSLNKHG